MSPAYENVLENPKQLFYLNTDYFLKAGPSLFPHEIIRENGNRITKNPIFIFLTYFMCENAMDHNLRPKLPYIDIIILFQIFGSPFQQNNYVARAFV